MDMDLSNLSERDRKIVEHSQRRVADIKIVAGLMSKGYPDEKIAEMMGSPVPHIHFLQRKGKLT